LRAKTRDRGAGGRLALALLLSLGCGGSLAVPATSPPASAVLEHDPASLCSPAPASDGGRGEALAALAPLLLGSDEGERRRAESFALDCARAYGRALGRRGQWELADVHGLATAMLIDPRRFAGDDAFRARVLPLLPRMLDPEVPPALRDDLLGALVDVPGFDLGAAGPVELAWGAVARTAAERRDPQEPGLAGPRIEDEPQLALLASVYSLPSTLVQAREAEALLVALRAADPARELLVLADPPQRRALAATAARQRVRLLPTYGRAYSPWPRDPFSFARAGDGAVRLVVRPNLQPGREEDGSLGPELVQDLPPDLDRAWGGVRWSLAAVPFHNGQVLLTRDAAWATLHTFEPRALQLLGVDRVPVATFDTAAGIAAYVGAVRRAADELAVLYGRPVRFVHPLPGAGDGDLPAAVALMRRLGGGAGYDLDSLVTFLPAGEGAPAALVADLEIGRRLLGEAPASEWAALAAAYDLRPGADVPAALAAEADSVRGRALGSFLDLVAAELEHSGHRVGRLPLLLVPTGLRRDAEGLRDAHFLLTWANVVVETRRDGVRAEGFASLLPAGDRLARAAFGAQGARLDLLPPLVGSVVRNGGYRCASNHLRHLPRQVGRPGAGV
jgi:hypothetical protein